MRRLATWGATVATTVSVATVVLLVTGWGSAVAANVNSVFVTNQAANPVPAPSQGIAEVKVTNGTPLGVKETNTDGNGNIKVGIEQGTAKVSQSGTWNVGHHRHADREERRRGRRARPERRMHRGRLRPARR